MSLKRFTNAKNLRGLGKPLLTKFFDKFQAELAAKNVTLPAVTMKDDAYFTALAKVFLSPRNCRMKWLKCFMPWWRWRMTAGRSGCNWR